MISDERLAKAAEEELGLVRHAINALQQDAIQKLSRAEADTETADAVRHELQALAKVATRLQAHIDSFKLKNSQS